MTDSTIPVLIPFKTDHGRREELFNFCKEVVWEQYGYQVVQGTDDSDPFIKSRAINSALDEVFAYNSDVFIFADADSWAPKDQIEAAIELCRKTGRMVIPFTRLKEYTKEVSDEALKSRVIPDPSARAETIRTKWYGIESSVLVIPTELIKKYGGWDERFYGWGGDDNAFAKKMAVIGHAVDPRQGKECHHKRGECQLRIPGYGYHIWHPVDSYGKKANDNNLTLYNRWLKTRTIEDIHFLETPINTTKEYFKSDNKYTIYLQDHHKDKYIHRAIESIQEHVFGNYNLVLVDDSNDPEFKIWIKHKYPQLEVVDVPNPGGYTMSMKTMVNTMREYSKKHGTIPVNWQADFIAVNPICLDDYYDLLTTHNIQNPNKQISQINFLRPPVFDGEIEVGDMMVNLENRIRRTRGFADVWDMNHKNIVYRMHNCGWSDNPSVINVKALEVPFPDKLDGEYQYGMEHLRNGFYSAREMYWTTVEHVGELDVRKYGRTH